MIPEQPATDGDLNQLRELLLSQDRLEVEAEMEALRARVADLEARVVATSSRTQHVSEILPAAIRHRRTARDDLSPALQPDVERAIHNSIRNDPAVMADALYPVMGPAIRKLVLSLFSFDQRRAGARYELSHAYLIHRATSLPLAVHVPHDDDFEADMVSGMMEALRAFVQDAFDASDVDGLQDLRVGDVTLWVEWGPDAVLALVVRGDAPQRLRLEMQRLLEDFHADYELALGDFTGDAAAFEPVSAELAGLTDRLSESETRSGTSRAVLLVVVLAALVALILFWTLS